MRKLGKFFALAAIAGVSFVACNKEIEDPTVEKGEFTYTFAISDGDDDLTKSYIGTEDGVKVINWDSTDQIGVYAVSSENTSYNRYGSIDVESTPNTFTISSYMALAKGDYVYAYAPYKNFSSRDDSDWQDPAKVPLTILASQTQDGTTYQANALPKVAIPYEITDEGGLAAKENKIVGDIKFVSVGALVDFKIYSDNEALQGESMKSVTFTADKNIAGEFIFDLTSVKYDDETTIMPKASELDVNTVTTTVTNPVALSNTKANAYDVYMAIAPGTYSGTVVVKTDKADYTYTLTSKEFKRGRILNLGINLRDNVREAEFDPSAYNWTLLKSATTIATGTKVIIAANASNVAMSTTQNGNNRGQVSIAKSGDNLTATSDVQAFEVVAGEADNSIAFKALHGTTKGQYIYAASSSSNHMKSQETNDENGSWAVSVTAEGVATITAQGENTKNIIRYNSSSSIFSCYSSGQSDVSIYVQGAATDPDAKYILSNGTISVPAVGGDQYAESAYSVSSTIDEETETITGTGSTGITDIIAEDGDIAFTMTPNYAKSKVNGTITLTLDSDETVTQEIPVQQEGSTLTVSDTEVTIPADGDEISFTVTSPEFGWTIVADDDTNIAFDDAGVASETATKVDVTSDIEAGDDRALIATLTVSRATDDPQAKTVKVYKAKKAAEGEAVAIYTGNFEEDGGHRANTSNSYTGTNKYTTGGVEWTLQYADAVTTGSPLNGSANVLARVAKNTTNSPSATSANILSASKTITKVEFLYKGFTALTLKVQYSTDNNTWNDLIYSTDSGVATSNGYSATVPNVTTSTFYLRFVGSVSSSTTSNRDFQLDNIVVYGKDGDGSGETPAPIEYDITITQPTGGTVTATVSGSSVMKAKAGDEVTLTISDFGTGYSFGSWDVEGVTVAATNPVTFTMPANAITVKANLNYSSGNNDPVTFIAGTDTGETSVTKEGITVSMSKMSRTDNYRTYANTSMTVTAEAGKTIKKVVVTCTASDTSNYGPGKFSAEEGDYSYSGTEGTWAGSATTVTLTASAQVRITKIVVTYE